VERVVIGISGASGIVYGIRLLQALKETPVETHLILTDAAKKVARLESSYTPADIESLADAVYDDRDLAAALSSGSFVTAGMVVAPCSIKSLSAIAHSYDDTLLARAADVQLKERRKLILVVRETPLHLGHLRLMTQVTECGAVVLPPMPSFYHHPRTIGDLVDHTVGKVLDQFGLDHHLFTPWAGGEPADAGKSG
jgi:flavin prenyltransferase